MSEEFRYLPVSSRDRQWGLYLTGAGLVADALPDADTTVHPQRYAYRWDKGRRLPKEYIALYHPHSTLEFEAESIRVIVPPGNFVVLTPGIWHRYRPVREPGWTEYWMCFGGAYADYLTKEGFFSREQSMFQVGMDARLLTLYRRLLERLHSSPLGLAQVLAANVMEILGMALALARTGATDKSSEAIVQQAKQILAENVDECVDIKDLALLLGIGYDQLRHVFKQLTGFGPYQYHLHLRIGRAKQLLAEAGLPIKEIASILKFDGPYHFSKMFKQYTGMCPSDWRNSVTNNEARVVKS